MRHSVHRPQKSQKGEKMIVSDLGMEIASMLELLAIYIFDDDLLNLMSFREWVQRCKVQGVLVHG